MIQRVEMKGKKSKMLDSFVSDRVNRIQRSVE